MRGAIVGDEMSLSALVDRYSPMITRRVAERAGHGVRRSEDFEDLVQEALTRVLAALGRFEWRDERSFHAWLQRIVDNACAGVGRSRRRAPLTLQLDADPPGDAVSPSRIVQRDERFERLRRAIQSLPENYREAVWLARIDGLKIAEVAARLEKSEVAVRQLITRGLRKIRERFGETGSIGLPPRRLERDDPDSSSREAAGAEGDDH